MRRRVCVCGHVSDAHENPHGHGPCMGVLNDGNNIKFKECPCKEFHMKKKEKKVKDG